MRWRGRVRFRFVEKEGDLSGAAVGGVEKSIGLGQRVPKACVSPLCGSSWRSAGAASGGLSGRSWSRTGAGELKLLGFLERTWLKFQKRLE